MATLRRRSTELALPLIGSTYTARMAEQIYNHLRGSLDSDEGINEIIHKLMKKSPNEIHGGPKTLTNILSVGNFLRPLNQSSRSPSRSDTPPPPTTQLPAAQNILQQSTERPGPDEPLIYHIQSDYKELNRVTHQKYLNTIRQRLDRTNTQDRIGFEDQDILRARGALEDNINIVLSALNLQLSNRK